MIKNIILITVDGLRYDYSGIITAKMNEVLGPGIEFANAYITGPNSIFSSLGLLCSKYVISPDEKESTRGPHSNHRKHKRTLLYEILKKNGFKTHLITSINYWYKLYGYDKGVDELIGHKEPSERKSAELMVLLKKNMLLFNLVRQFYKVIKSGLNIAKKEEKAPYSDAKEIAEIVKAVVNQQKDNKMFMHIHYLDAHTPPNVANEFLKNFKKKELCRNKFGMEEFHRYREILDNAEKNGKKLQKMKNALDTYKTIYYYEIVYAAENIKKMLKTLIDLGGLKDSLVIMTADHGLYIQPEGKLFGYGYPMKNKEEAVKVFYDNLIHVPLAVWGIGQKKIDKIVSLIDLAPTILECVGVEKPPEWYGDSFFSTGEKPAISETVNYEFGCYCSSIRTKDWVFVYNEETKQEYLFKRSPEEKQDLSRERPEIVKQMYKILEDHKEKKKGCWREYLKKDIKKIIKGGDVDGKK